MSRRRTSMLQAGPLTTEVTMLKRTAKGQPKYIEYNGLYYECKRVAKWQTEYHKRAEPIDERRKLFGKHVARIEYCGREIIIGEFETREAADQAEIDAILALEGN